MLGEKIKALGNWNGDREEHPGGQVHEDNDRTRRTSRRHKNTIYNKKKELRKGIHVNQTKV